MLNRVVFSVASPLAGGVAVMDKAAWLKNHQKDIAAALTKAKTAQREDAVACTLLKMGNDKDKEHVICAGTKEQAQVRDAKAAGGRFVSSGLLYAGGGGVVIFEVNKGDVSVRTNCFAATYAAGVPLRLEVIPAQVAAAQVAPAAAQVAAASAPATPVAPPASAPATPVTPPASGATQLQATMTKVVQLLGKALHDHPTRKAELEGLVRLAAQAKGEIAADQADAARATLGKILNGLKGFVTAPAPPAAQQAPDSAAAAQAAAPAVAVSRVAPPAALKGDDIYVSELTRGLTKLSIPREVPQGLKVQLERRRDRIQARIDHGEIVSAERLLASLVSFSEDALPQLTKAVNQWRAKLGKLRDPFLAGSVEIRDLAERRRDITRLIEDCEEHAFSKWVGDKEHLEEFSKFVIEMGLQDLEIRIEAIQTHYRKTAPPLEDADQVLRDGRAELDSLEWRYVNAKLESVPTTQEVISPATRIQRIRDAIELGRDPRPELAAARCLLEVGRLPEYRKRQKVLADLEKKITGNQGEDADAHAQEAVREAKRKRDEVLHEVEEEYRIANPALDEVEEVLQKGAHNLLGPDLIEPLEVIRERILDSVRGGLNPEGQLLELRRRLADARSYQDDSRRREASLARLNAIRLPERPTERQTAVLNELGSRITQCVDRGINPEPLLKKMEDRVREMEAVNAGREAFLARLNATRRPLEIDKVLSADLDQLRVKVEQAVEDGTDPELLLAQLESRVQDVETVGPQRSELRRGLNRIRAQLSRKGEPEDIEEPEDKNLQALHRVLKSVSGLEEQRLDDMQRWEDILDKMTKDILDWVEQYFDPTDLIEKLESRVKAMADSQTQQQIGLELAETRDPPAATTRQAAEVAELRAAVGASLADGEDPMPAMEILRRRFEQIGAADAKRDGQTEKLEGLADSGGEWIKALQDAGAEPEDLARLVNRRDEAALALEAARPADDLLEQLAAENEFIRRVILPRRKELAAIPIPEGLPPDRQLEIDELRFRIRTELDEGRDPGSLLDDLRKLSAGGAQ
jgi:hypothetical protein